MVVFLPVLDGEYLRTCTVCDRTMLCSTEPTRTAFYLLNRSSRKFRAQCRWCYGPRTRVWHIVNAERVKELERGYRIRRAASAEERRMEKEEAEELARIDELLEAERGGIALPRLDEVKARKVRGESGIEVDAQPFKTWLLKLERSAGTRTKAAAIIMVDPGVITEWLAADTVDLETVDRALSREGGWMVWDLYGDLADALTERPLEAIERQDDTVCRTPGCRTRIEPSERFCEPHLELYARVREELAADSDRFRSQIGRKLAPRCCNPACDNPRPSRQRYCVECEDAGWSEEDIT